MQADKVDLFLATKAKSLPPERIPALREQLLAIDESKYILISSVEMKDPTTLLIISLFLGTFGIDRFMLKQTGMGVLKLLTGGVCGILTIIDWFSVQKKTRQFNFDTLMTTLQLNPASVPVTAPPSVPTGIAVPTAGVQTNGEVISTAEQTATTNTQTTESSTYTPPASVYIPSVKSESSVMKSFPLFLKAFLKKPFTAIVASPLNLPDGLIVAGAQAIINALLGLFVLGNFRQMDYLFRSYGGGAKIFFSMLIISVLATAALVGLHLLFGKVVFKGENEGGIKKLFPLVVATEFPLIAATALSIILSFVFPSASVLLLAFGAIASIALSSAVFVGEFKLSNDSWVLASTFTYTTQVIVLYILFSIIF